MQIRYESRPCNFKLLLATSHQVSYVHGYISIIASTKLKTNIFFQECWKLPFKSILNFLNWVFISNYNVNIILLLLSAEIRIFKRQKISSDLNFVSHLQIITVAITLNFSCLHNHSLSGGLKIPALGKSRRIEMAIKWKGDH